MMAVKDFDMNLLSYAEAADIKKVSRQSIRGLSKKKWGFMVDGGVDIDHSDWQNYLEGKLPGTPRGKKSTKKKVKQESGAARDKKTDKKNSKSESGKSAGKSKFDLLTDFVPGNLREQKIYLDCQKINFELQEKLSKFISRDIIESKVGVMAQALQSNFVDLSRRVSPRITSKLKRTGMEKEVEKIIAGEIQKGIQAVKKAIMDIAK